MNTLYSGLLLGLQYLAHPGTLVTLATLGYLTYKFAKADWPNLVLLALV